MKWLIVILIVSIGLCSFGFVDVYSKNRELQVQLKEQQKAASVLSSQTSFLDTRTKYLESVSPKIIERVKVLENDSYSIELNLKESTNSLSEKTRSLIISIDSIQNNLSQLKDSQITEMDLNELDSDINDIINILDTLESELSDQSDRIDSIESDLDELDDLQSTVEDLVFRVNMLEDSP